MAAKTKTRSIITVAIILGIVGALTCAFWPRPMLVDMMTVTRAPMIVTINEEGRTRVHSSYIVSTPTAGRLLRVDALPGDEVEMGKTIVARMLPTSPAALDIRTKEQARAAVNAAEAAQKVARADVNRAIAEKELADADLDRTRTLSLRGTVSQAALERAERTARAAGAALDTAAAAVAMRKAELESAQAYLIGFDDQGLASALDASREDAIELTAPADGRILQIIQQSATTLPAGAPIMEIGNTEDDLEVVVELLSTDAVQVSPGLKVIIDHWGGKTPLQGEVKRVEPWGFTKFSALGVEEQRVNVIIRFISPPEDRKSLGHGYRVEARIISWEKHDALTVPTGALFRDGDGWALFVVKDGVAAMTPLEIEANNGTHASVFNGLSEGDSVVLYPSSELADGDKVSPRPVE